MTDYEIFKMGWKYGWASEEQMKEAVAYKLITAEQYQEITGQEYTTTAA